VYSACDLDPPPRGACPCFAWSPSLVDSWRCDTPYCGGTAPQYVPPRDELQRRERSNAACTPLCLPRLYHPYSIIGTPRSPRFYHPYSIIGTPRSPRVYHPYSIIGTPRSPLAAPSGPESAPSGPESAPSGPESRLCKHKFRRAQRRPPRARTTNPPPLALNLPPRATRTGLDINAEGPVVSHGVT
jgi:hypothetical protein